jgi:hypothetical protein
MINEFTFQPPTSPTGARRDMWQAAIAVVATTVVAASFFFWSHAQLGEKAAEAAACTSSQALVGHAILVIDRTDPITLGQKQALGAIVKQVGNDLRADEKFSIYAIDGEEPNIPHKLFEGCSPGSRATADSVTQSPELVQRAFERTILSPALSLIDGLNVRATSGQSPIIETMRTLTLLRDFSERVPNRRLDIFSDMLENSTYSQYRDTLNYQELKRSRLFRSIQLDLRGVRVVIHYLRRPRDARWQSSTQIQFWRDLVEDAGGTVAITFVDDSETPAVPPATARVEMPLKDGAPGLVPLLQVSTPAGSARVCALQEVLGNIGNTAIGARDRLVWIVVHPLETPEYWVQQPATVDGETGRWATLVHFGDRGSHDGKSYEIQAFVSLRQQLKVGQVLTHWPEARSTSNVVYGLVRGDC